MKKQRIGLVKDSFRKTNKTKAKKIIKSDCLFKRFKKNVTIVEDMLKGTEENNPDFPTKGE